MLTDIARRCRLDALEMVYRAGKGHLGTSFSSMDILVAVRSIMGPGDIFFSSKGHDAVGQYAVLSAFGLLARERLWTYRKPGGLPGHPTTDIPGIVCSTGSLGMGLSKACGFVHAKRMHGDSGRVFVLLGDGEMSEGQNYEAMLYASKQNMKEILAVVDCNGLQQDGPSAMDWATIQRMFRAAGWACAVVSDADADDLVPLLRQESQTPRCLIVRTVKGKGVSFMENDVSWHQRGPTDDEYQRAREELG